MPAERYGALAVAVAAFSGFFAIFAFLAFRKTGGLLVYALDDPYIHMAAAAGLVKSGVWGINPGEFSGTSSSPLWTLVLAALQGGLGRSDAYPLALNFLAGVGILVLWWRVLGRFIRGSAALSAALVAGTMFLCLPTLVLVGMEHLPHTLLSIAALAVVSAILASHGRAPPGQLVLAFVLCALNVACRFEGMFFAIAAVSLLLWRRKWLAAAVVATGTALPVAGYAGFSLRHGGAWLPNSVLLKGHVPHLGSLRGVIELLGQAPTRAVYMPWVAALIAAGAGWVYLLHRDPRPAARQCIFMTWLFSLSALAHLQFAVSGSLYRYEAYVTAMGLTAAFAAIPLLLEPPHLPPGPRKIFAWRLTLAALAAAALMLTAKAGDGVRRSLSASGNIYEQQYQMARFLREEMPGARVAVNDLGAVSWYGDAYVLDLWGLASTEVFRLKRAGAYDTAAINRLCREHGIGVAIVYDAWFQDRESLPAGWQKVEEWTIHDNVACGFATVSFYAVDSRDRALLARKLEDFAPRLPKRVARRVIGAPL